MMRSKDKVRKHTTTIPYTPRPKETKDDHV